MALSFTEGSRYILDRAGFTELNVPSFMKRSLLVQCLRTSRSCAQFLILGDRFGEDRLCLTVFDRGRFVSVWVVSQHPIEIPEEENVAMSEYCIGYIPSSAAFVPMDTATLKYMIRKK